MSVMRLRKDHNGAKKGDIIQVPFIDGKRLIKEGIACRSADPIDTADSPAKPADEAPARKPGKPQARKPEPATAPSEEPSGTGTK